MNTIDVLQANAVHDNAEIARLKAEAEELRAAANKTATELKEECRKAARLMLERADADAGWRSANAEIARLTREHREWIDSVGGELTSERASVALLRAENARLTAARAHCYCPECFTKDAEITRLQAQVDSATKIAVVRAEVIRVFEQGQAADKTEIARLRVELDTMKRQRDESEKR